MQAEETTADPRLHGGRWRADLAECLAMYRAVTGDASQALPLAPTDSLTFGPYTVVGLLGQGGMGRVYAARAADGTRVAIKALIAHAAARDAALPRFQRELAAARRISGELTARVVDADLDADPPWLATEYIQGPALSAVLEALGPLPSAAVTALALGIASALVDIHAAGVVHRDLKPSNILLASDGLRVVDFGIARTTDGITLTGPGWTLGTPAYMAPEQVVGEPAQAPADVFALGSILVCAATGSPPFGVDEATTVMYRTVHDTPVLDGVAEPLRGVVEACLDKDPARRPTPGAVIERLLGLLGLGSAQSETTRREIPAVPAGLDPETTITPAMYPTRNSAEIAVLEGEVTQEVAVVPVVPVVPVAPPVPADDGAEPSAQDPARRFAWRAHKRLIAGVALGTVLLVSGIFAVLAATHQHKNQAAPQGGGQVSRGAAAPAPGASAPLPHRFVTGPGCPASPWADTLQAIPAADQLVPNVGGGDPECGAVAVTFRKSGATAPAAGYTWEFKLRRAARCTLSIYIANTNSSSGLALYQVTVAGQTSQFRLNQALGKGTWVQPKAISGLTLTDGTVQLLLTDAGSYVGDRFHVTASSVRADCV
jgi:serine/threonine protein kinase